MDPRRTARGGPMEHPLAPAGRAPTARAWAALVATLALTGCVAGNGEPRVVPDDEAVEASPRAVGEDWLNGTFSIAGRLPPEGTAVNLAGSRTILNLKPTPGTDYVTVELRWDESKVDRLRVWLQWKTADSDWRPVDNQQMGSPFYMASKLRFEGEYRTTVFVADEGDAALDVAFEEVVRYFSARPDPSDRVFAP